MSKFYRVMTNNIGTTSFLITMVTHYRPRSKFCANDILSWQMKSHDYKNIHNKSYRTFKGCVPNIYCKYKDIKTCGYWNMSFERKLLTMKKRQHWNAFCHLTNDHIITLCFLWWKTNKNFILWLLQNYNTFSKHKMLNLSFKTFFIRILAKKKRQSNVRERRRHTGVSSFTVN